MDKNTLLGLLLMAAVIFGFTWLNSPSEEDIAAAKAQQEQLAAEQERQVKEAAEKALRPDSVSASVRASVANAV